MAVELILVCQATTPPHEFKKSFDGAIDWTEVTLWMNSNDPRCDLHPQAYDPCYWDEQVGQAERFGPFAKRLYAIRSSLGQEQ